jgi:ubiquinone/menaquinone biosynthesis C-methylase UbiE
MVTQHLIIDQMKDSMRAPWIAGDFGALTLPDKSVDAAVSQFAFLHEGDVAVSARELSGVLKDGTPFSVAAWDVMKLNTLFSRAAQVL